MRTGGGRGTGGGGGGAGDAQDPPRLVEGGGDVPPAQAWAIGLLQRTPSHRPPLGRKQRVRLGLAQSQKRRARALVLRPAMAVLVLVALGAVASAALGRWPALVAGAYHRLIAAAAPAPETTRVIPSRPSQAGVSAAPPAGSALPPAALPGDPVPGAGSAGLAVAPPVVLPVLAPPVVVQMAAPAARGARRAAASGSVRDLAAARARGAIASARAHHTPPVPASVDDTAPVIEAMRALRVQGDPVRARALLTRYLLRYPNGTLAEEALAISIEAANVHRDGDAAALARRYLRLYPAGHFAVLARQTLDGGGSAPAGN